MIKYFGHPQSAIGSSASATKNTSANSNNNSCLVMMSNSPPSGATNSASHVPSPSSLSLSMNNNNTNGMSSSGSTLNGVCASASAPPTPPAITNKMGSRRIFSPQFKLLVLESYRNDSDCKGNQRATARKYGIHRRQIQKWLQCETALRTSVSAGGATSPSNSSNTSSSSPNSTGGSGGYPKFVDSNNNNHQQQKRTLKSSSTTLLSTSSNQARHCVVAESSVNESNGAVRVAAVAVEEHSRLIGGCGSMGEVTAAHMNMNTLTQQHRLGSTHTRQNSMEFFSPTTSLIINGHGAGGAGGSTMKVEREWDREGEDRKMNEAAVPIKPEFRFNAAAAPPPPPSHHHPSMNRGVEMPSTAMLNQHHHHHHRQQHHLQEDAPHHSLVATLPPFISTIYGPAGLLAFPTPRLTPFGFDYPTLRHLSPSIPIDLSMGNTERRHAGELRHSDLLIHADDARVPTQSSSGDVCVSQPSPLSPAADASTVAASPMDLSCGNRKRKAACPVEQPAKPPKLFKPYLLDDKEEEEDLKVVDENDDESLSTTTTTSSLKGDSFLDQDLTGLKDRPGPRFDYPTVWSQQQQQQYYHPGGSSPTYDHFYYGHESLTLYPSPHQYRYESQSSLSPSAASSPLHHPSRPASLSSEGTFGSYHPLSPASSEVRSSPPVFSLDLKLQSVQPNSSAWKDIRTRVGAVFYE